MAFRSWSESILKVASWEDSDPQGFSRTAWMRWMIRVPPLTCSEGGRLLGNTNMKGNSCLPLAREWIPSANSWTR